MQEMINQKNIQLLSFFSFRRPWIYYGGGPQASFICVVLYLYITFFILFLFCLLIRDLSITNNALKSKQDIF